MLIVLLIATMSQIPVATPSDQGKALAAEALSLIRRAIEEGMPQEFPKALKARVPEHVIDDFEVSHRFDPTEGFFEPSFLRWKNRQLYKDLRKYWRRPPSDRLRSVPYLGESYFQETGLPQGAIVRLITQIIDDAFRDEEHWSIGEAVYLDIAERSTVREHRLKILDEFSPNLSDRGLDRLIDLAKGRDREDDKARALEVLTISSNVYKVLSPQRALDFLYETAATEQSAQVRIWAISNGLVKTYGKERWLPVYLRVLKENINGSRLLADITLREVAMLGKYPEALPLTMEALDSNDPITRVNAIWGLESIVGTTDEQMGYAADFHIVLMAESDHGFATWQAVDAGKIEIGMELEARFDEPSTAALNRIASIWRAWWLKHGQDFLKEHGVNTQQ